MNTRINARIKRAEHSPTLHIHQKVNQLREGGREVVHLGFGESPFAAPRPVCDALRRHAGDTRYLPSQGLPALREAAADYLKWRFDHDADPSRIIVGPGSKELIFDALTVLEGDLILPAPSWVSYDPQGKLLGKRVLWAHTDPSGGWRLTAEVLANACAKSKSAQKILILNSPCNPTGAVYASSELKDIAILARRHNVIVISDEIYAEITFTRRRYASIAAFCPERTVVTTGLSKGFSAGGYRVGILSLPKGMSDVAPHMVCLASETFSCVSAPIQHAAVVAFGRDKAVRDHVKDTAAIHRMAGEYLWRGLTALGVRCPKPEGAFYLFPDFAPFARAIRRHGIRTDVELCTDMLERQGVAMLPGIAFGVPTNRLAVRMATVDYDGARALRAFRKHRPRSAGEKRAFVERLCPQLRNGVGRIAAYLRTVT